MSLGGGAEAVNQQGGKSSQGGKGDEVKMSRGDAGRMRRTRQGETLYI